MDGVDRLPKDPYPAGGEKDKTHGNDYHRKVLMIMLIKLKPITNTNAFAFSLENSDAEKFDDFYLQMMKDDGKHFLFMQIKHKDESNLTTIKYDDLFGKGENRSKFDLKEYFLSFWLIRKKILDGGDAQELEDFDKFAVFFLFTNQKLDFTSPTDTSVVNPNNTNDVIRFFDSSNRCILNTDFAFENGHYQIKFDTNTSFAEQFLKNIDAMCTTNAAAVEKKKQTNKDSVTKKQKDILQLALVQEEELKVMIELFTRKLFFSVQQHSEKELNETIDNHFKNEYNLLKTDSVVETYNSAVYKWMTVTHGTEEIDKKTVKTAKWIKNSDLEELFKNLELEIDRMSAFGVEHYEHLRLSPQRISFADDLPIQNFDQSQNCLLHIQSSSVLLSRYKLVQFLENHSIYGKKGSFAFTENLKLTKEIVSSFASPNGIILVILECQGEIHNGFVNQLLDMTISQKQNVKKKVILICSETAHLDGKYKNPNHWENIKDDPVFKTLSNESKNKILQKEILFQNQKVTFYKILLENQHCNIPKSISNLKDGLNLTYEALICLLEEKTVELNKTKGISDLNSAYSKFNKVIEEKNMRTILLNQIRSDSILVLDGQGIRSIDKLIDILKIFELGEKQQLETSSMEIRNVSETENFHNKNIILFKDNLNEDNFKNICRHNENSAIYWLHFSNNNLKSDWIWKIIYDPILFDRTLKRKTVKSTLKKKLLDEQCPDHFVVIGSSDDLRKIFRIGEEEMEKLQLSSKFVIIKDELQAAYQFKKFSKLSKNVHKFKIIKNEIIWEESFVNGYQSSKGMKTFDLIENERISIIVDDPGMGKSTLLTQIAKAKIKDSWVIRLNLKECENELKNVGKYSQLNLDTLIEFLMEFGMGSKKCPLTRDCLHYILSGRKNLRKLSILMDAYDEISEHSRQSVDAIVKFFEQSQNGTNNRLVITSRHHPNLEENLDQLFIIQMDGFDADKRKNYLKQYFTSRSSLLKVQNNAAQFEQKINELVSHLLSAVEKIFADESKNIVTVPLQMRLISEAYEDEVYRCITNNTEINISDISIQGLYERIIEGKINIYMNEKIRVNLMGNDEDVKAIKEDKVNGIRKLLWKSAIKTVCRGEDCSQIFLDIDSTQNEKSNKEIPVRVGIALRMHSDDNYEFIHLTFAEYLSADFVMNGIYAVKTAKFLVNTIFMEKDYNNVRYFIEEMLKKKQFSNNKLELLELIIDKELTKKNYISNTSSEMVEDISTTPPDDLSSDEEVEDSDMSSDHEEEKEGLGTVLTILYRTCSENNPNILKLLSTIIDFKNEQIKKYFLDGFRKDIARGIFGIRQTPLHHASLKGFKSIVEFLVNRGVKFEARDNSGQMPIHLASKEGHQSIVEFLVNRGAIIDAGDIYNRTPLHLASQEGHLSIVEFLVDRKVNIEANSIGKETPLHYASEEGHLSIVEFLVDRGGNLEAEDYLGGTPLHRASEGHLSIVKFLVNRGVKFDARDDSGKTSLHYASKKGHQSIVEFLVDRGGNIDATDNLGKTPLNLALHQGHQSIVEYLEEKSREQRS